jgi:hypothetical protein
MPEKTPPLCFAASVLTLNLDCFVAVVGGQWSAKLAARIGARLHIHDKPYPGQAGYPRYAHPPASSY